MLLLVIFLIFIILSIIWYLVVRNVDLEPFPDNNTQITIKVGSKFLQGEKGKPLKLGNDMENGLFKLIDNPDYPDGVQIESVVYPGYLIAYQQGKWVLTSKYYLDSIKKTIFIPLGQKVKDLYALLNLYNKQCISVKNNNILVEKFNSKNKSQFVKIKKIN